MIHTFYYFGMCIKSSVALHDKMFESILKVPCRFFDTNPAGRILNRFSKDLGTIDELLPSAFIEVFLIGINFIGVMAVILTVRPWVFLPTILLGVVFVILRCFYMAS